MGFRFLAYFKIFLSFHGGDFFRFTQHQIVAPELLIFRNAVDQAVLTALAQRFDDVVIWAPRGPQPAVVPDSGTVVMAGQQQWQVDQQSGHLLVRPVG